MFFRSRELENKRASFAELAGQKNLSPALSYDPVYHRKAQSAAAALFFGGEERLEDPRFDGIVDADAGIADFEGDKVPRGGILRFTTGGRMPQADRKRSAIRHGVTRVDHQVEQD